MHKSSSVHDFYFYIFSYNLVGDSYYEHRFVSFFIDFLFFLGGKGGGRLFSFTNLGPTLGISAAVTDVFESVALWD